jgi:hypothetical protein
VQVSLCPCRLMAPGDASIAPALVQLPQLTGLKLGMLKAGDHLRATRAAGGWRVFAHDYLRPGMAAVLARSFSGAAAPVGQQEQLVQQPAAEANAGQRSRFTVGVEVEPGAPSPEQASELASLGRALAAFDDVHLDLDLHGGLACRAGAHALLAPVAARLVVLGFSGASSADAVLGELQRLALPRLVWLTFHPEACTLDAVTATACLGAPRLATITLKARIAGSRAAAVAAVTALAMGRPQPVGDDGRPVGLTVVVSKEALNDEELESVRGVVAAVRVPGCVTVVRLANRA